MLHRTELADARMLNNTYIHQTNDCRQQIQENIEEKKVLVVKSENAKVITYNVIIVGPHYYTECNVIHS